MTEKKKRGRPPRARLRLGRTQLERPRTGVTEQRPTSSAVMFDKDGTVIWKAP